MSLVRKWMRWLPCGALLAAAGCAQFPAGMPYPETPQSQVNAARMHESRGQTEQARTLYESAVARNPNLVDAHHRLALLNARQRKWGPAEQHFLAALRTQPANPKILADYGYMEYCQERLLEAERTTRQALVADPENRRVTNNLALIVGRQARYQESLALFRQAGTEAQSHANIAWIYAQNGETELAAKSYARAIALDGNNRAATIAFAQLCESRPAGQEELGLEEDKEQRTLPPATPRRRSNGRLVRTKVPPAAETTETSVQPVALDDRSTRHQETLHLDLDGRQDDDQPSRSLKRRTTENFAPPETPHVTKSVRPPVVEEEAPPPPPVRPARPAAPPAPQPAPRAAAAMVESPDQPSIRSKQMAERATRSLEATSPVTASAQVLPTISTPTVTIPPPVLVPKSEIPTAAAPPRAAQQKVVPQVAVSPVISKPTPVQPTKVPSVAVPTVTIPEFVNPLAPENPPTTELTQTQSWAEPISRTIAERPEIVPLPPKPQLQVAPVSVERPPVEQPTKLEKPVEPGLSVPELPALSPKKPKPAKPLKVVEPLDYKKLPKPAAGLLASPAKKVTSPSWHLAKPAEVRKQLIVTPKNQVAKRTKTAAKPVVAAKADEPLPDLPAASATPKAAAKPVEKIGDKAVAGKSVTPAMKAPVSPSSHRFSFRSLMTPTRNPEAGVKTAQLSEMKTTNKPAVRRLPVQSQLIRPQLAETSVKAIQQPVEKLAEKAAPQPPEKSIVRRTNVNSIPANDPFMELADSPAPVRQVAHRSDLPFLAENEPEPLPELKAEDEMDRLPTPPKQSASKPLVADVKKTSASAKPTVAASKSVAVAAKPMVIAPKPVVAVSKPVAVASKPAAVAAKPVMSPPNRVPPPLPLELSPPNEYTLHVEPPIQVAPPVPPSTLPVPKSSPAPKVVLAPTRVPTSKPAPASRVAPVSKDPVEFDFPVGDFPTASDATEQDIAQLIELLRKGTPVERESAATALGELGALAANAVPGLVEALVDPSVYTRHAARVALEKIEAATNLSEIQQTSGNKSAKR